MKDVHVQGEILYLDGQFSEAEPLLRRAAKAGHVKEDPAERDDDYEANTAIMLKLAGILERTGRDAEAGDLRRRAAARS
ncbi:hypothetical protein [Actinomadura sediminis]|uniref:Tetratricopeptide repeat protein n=1 Tax=Actinomadura sediminis TaxID=1038904 RepID=A0ABW3ESY0_9ACTN